jgi:hypothetical protein
MACPSPVCCIWLLSGIVFPVERAFLRVPVPRRSTCPGVTLTICDGERARPVNADYRAPEQRPEMTDNR